MQRMLPPRLPIIINTPARTSAQSMATATAIEEIKRNCANLPAAYELVIVWVPREHVACTEAYIEHVVFDGPVAKRSFDSNSVIIGTVPHGQSMSNVITKVEHRLADTQHYGYEMIVIAVAGACGQVRDQLWAELGQVIEDAKADDINDKFFKERELVINSQNLLR